MLDRMPVPQALVVTALSRPAGRLRATLLPAALAALWLAGCIQQPPEDPAQANVQEPAAPITLPVPVSLPDTPSAPAAASGAGAALSITPDPLAGTLPPEPSQQELAALMKSEAFLRSHLSKLKQMQTEAQVAETAPWFGTTGLSAEQEQRLPRYVRMELNQKLGQPQAVAAADLQFIGHFGETDGTVYYWQLPPNQVSRKAATEGSPRYAYIRQATEGGSYMDWGNRLPPRR